MRNKTLNTIQLKPNLSMKAKKMCPLDVDVRIIGKIDIYHFKGNILTLTLPI